ncbi:MAG: hypothetical protein GXP55_24970 [Deltaproteobacteria bacterium]|nr:hypothetical protein [Deltaproteobacteria bacterium]
MIALSLASCGGTKRTLSVDLQTDFVSGLEFRTVHTEAVLSISGTETSRATNRPADVGDDFLGGRRIGDFDLDQPGTYAVEVSLVREDGSVLAKRTVRVTVQRSFGVTVLITRSCEGVTCPGAGDDPGATTCAGGRCVPPECGPDDPSACGVAECVGDVDCAPANACSAGQCIGGLCFQAPRSGGCSPREWCSPELGCQPLPGNAFDAGPGPCVPELEVCNGVDDDCDGMVDEGIDLATDPLNCGSCNTVCGGDHATAGCERGVCTLECDAGFEDCDGDPSNGCEADLTAATNCGSCSTICNGSTPLCVRGTSALECVAECPAGTTLCSATCADLDTSLSHCGACGAACAPAHSTAACVAGVCGVGSCDVGFADCDGDPSNGCEADLSLASQCGVCGRVCPGATPYCVGSPGSYSCTNGCSDGLRGGDETDIDCGGLLCPACRSGSACGRDADCAGTAVCNAGRCAACGECEAGATDSRSCGLCGTQTRSCGASCSWGGWSSCGGEGVCTPGTLQNQACGNCGNQSRTCSTSCQWPGWSSCSGGGVCSPGATQSQACGNCGSQIRNCSGGCFWNPYGACTGEGACAPGSKTSSGCFNSCQTMTCGSSCSWPAAPDSCTGCSCSTANQCGFSCPSGFHPTSRFYSSSCGTCCSDNSSRCAPDCGSTFTQCNFTCPSGYHATSYFYSSSCGTCCADNSARCALNAGSNFNVCGFTCPSGYRAGSRFYSSSCGTCCSDNSTRCTKI